MSEEYVDIYEPEQYVAGVPGSAFGAPGTLRFSLAASEDNLKAGFAGLQRLVQSLA